MRIVKRAVQHGAVAAGDIHTAQAAAEVLKAGGNAFDAALAALFAASVAEPVLSSLGGGGFLLARPADGPPVLYDFFAHTPKRKKSEVDFYPVMADFGTVTQEFHIGPGSIATPGVVKGAFQVLCDLGWMAPRDVVEPARHLARQGFPVSALQAYIFGVVEPIYRSTPACRAQYASPGDPSRLIGEGEILRLPDQADFLDALAREGDDLFYRGEVAAQVARDLEDTGGHLERRDFEHYRVEKRDPLTFDYRGARILTNPPPSAGGILVGFALDLLRALDVAKMGWGSPDYVHHLVKAMDLTNQARLESGVNLDAEAGGVRLLDPVFLQRYVGDILGRPRAHRGTTHISVIDKKGNAAALTVSNGEGSGYIPAKTGVVLNNMLGEEDINPKGFHQWPEGTRLSSMMAPSLIERPDGLLVALGSGGSNRIRTALLQAIVAILDFDMPIARAVVLPRLHFEGELLNMEPGFPDGVADTLGISGGEVRLWDGLNLFFGGVHAVEFDAASGALSGGGDPRRGGVALVV